MLGPVEPWRRCLRGATVLALGATLTACETSGDRSFGTATRSFVDDVFSIFGGGVDPEVNALVMTRATRDGVDVDEVEDAEVVAAYADDCDEAKRRPSASFEVGYAEIRETRVGVWPVKEGEAYLNALLDRIVACAPFEPVPAQVVVAPKGGISATAHPDGLIELSIDTFRKAEDNENAIAFVLAHEYAHLLLNHHARAEATARRNEIFSVVSEAVLLGDDALRATGNDKNLDDKLKYPTLANRSMDLLFESSWGRQDEYEADMLGLHLTMLAGFDGFDGYAAFFRDLRRQKTFEERVRELVQDRERMLRYVANAEGDDTKSIAKDAAGDFVADIGSKLADSLKDSHPTPDERQDVLITYEEHHFDLLNDLLDSRHYGDTLRLNERFKRPSLQSVKDSRTMKHALAAFDAAEDVHAATSGVSSMTELAATGKSFEELLAKAKRGVSGDPGLAGRPSWLSTNAYGRIAFSQLRTVEGRNDLAIVGFRDFALKNPDAPLRVYQFLFDRQLAAGDLRGAEETLAKASDAFGPENVVLYPMRIEIAFRRGENVTPLLAGCRLSGDARIAKICRQWEPGGPIS